ncbi:MAG: L-serine ammonia-lyase [Acholeplasmataceae bacterium]
MYSLRSLYQIGYGPSSSHTMGPAKAVLKIKEKNPKANRYDITLYNSLALTGKGHLTEEAIMATLDGAKTTFFNQIDVQKHPNHLTIKIYEDDIFIKTYEVTSIGGGRILFEGEALEEKDVYKEQTFKQIKKYCKSQNISLFDYVKLVEGDGIVDDLSHIWDAMKSAIQRGINATGILPGPLKLKRKSHELYHYIAMHEMPEITENRIVSSYAFAVSEENAAGGLIVTAPTCGACGVLPSVLQYTLEKHDFIDEKKVIEALAVAGIFGNLIKHNASISGAVAGCQAEIGSACSMAAAAHAYLLGQNIDQIEYAAEIAMEHHLGLTCDPVNGYVQIPCIERNAVAALRAMNASRLAFFLSDSRKISFDTVVEAMYQTGLDMNNSYKETALGGLAKYYKEDDNDANCW